MITQTQPRRSQCVASLVQSSPFLPPRFLPAMPVPEKQFLVYSMNYRVGEDLAMVLPLPVPVGSKEDAVQFIDLHGYGEFFADLQSGFPVAASDKRRPLSRSMPSHCRQRRSRWFRSAASKRRLCRRSKTLRASMLGFACRTGFGTSCPPTKSRGLRCSSCARMPARCIRWRLRFLAPIASKLFFPTVHIHDGKVHDTAHFDHSLYCQVGSQYGKTTGWEETPQLASAFVKVAATKGIVDGSAHCYRKTILGNQKNQDTWL
jgi:hypothetical protein